MNGTIKTISADRGFGFIRGDDGRDYFFHRSEIRGGLRFDELREGQKVTFEPGQGDRGPRASAVSLAAA